MPMRLNVGASRKVTDNNYGSRGASVNLEMELDSALIGEPARLQEQIRRLFGLVRTSLAEELNGGNGHGPAKPVAPTNGSPTRPPAANGNGPARPAASRPATPAQCKALYALARQQGLGLADWLQSQAGVRRPDDLSLKEASQLIDALKGEERQRAG